MKKRSSSGIACTLLSLILILTLFPAGAALAYGGKATMKAGETKDFTAPSYTTFVYSWSVTSGSKSVSIQSGKSSMTCTVKALAAGKATLECVYTRGKGTSRERSYTDTYTITVEASEKDMSKQVIDGIGISPKDLQPNTALVFVDDEPTLFFLTKSSTVETADPDYTYDSYTLDSIKDGLLDQEISLKIRHSQKQDGSNSDPYAADLTYYEYHYDPVMYGFRPKSSTPGTENLQVLTTRSDGLKHVEGVFITKTSSKWSKRQPELYGAFCLTLGKTAEPAADLYANYGGHLPNDEDVLKWDREVHEMEIRTREQDRAKRQEARALKTCKDCGGTGFCSHCCSLGHVYVPDSSGTTRRVSCSHCNGLKTCPTCHGKGKTR